MLLDKMFDLKVSSAAMPTDIVRRVFLHLLPADSPGALCFPGIHKRRGYKTVLQCLHTALVQIYKEACVSLGDLQT